jgi:hypothetical protein
LRNISNQINISVNIGEMGKEILHPLPFKDPVTGGDLYVSELQSDASGISMRGRFEIPRYARLDAEQARFLETFLRCRGVITAMERELGISYPTVRARLDGLLQALDLTPVKEDAARKDRGAESKKAILDQLERGEITPEEAKALMKEVAQ